MRFACILSAWQTKRDSSTYSNRTFISTGKRKSRVTATRTIGWSPTSARAGHPANGTTRLASSSGSLPSTVGGSRGTANCTVSISVASTSASMMQAESALSSARSTVRVMTSRVRSSATVRRNPRSQTASGIFRIIRQATCVSR